MPPEPAQVVPNSGSGRFRQVGLAELVDGFAGREAANTLPLELGGHGPHEVEDARVHAVVLAECLEVPPDEDEVTPGAAQMLGVGVGAEGISRPGLVAEAIADVVRELVMAAEEREIPLAVAVEMGRLPPVEHPLAAVEHSCPVSGLQKGVVDLVVHDHLGRVGHADLFIEEILGEVLAPPHLRPEEL